jgi:hypothetical protein
LDAQLAQQLANDIVAHTVVDHWGYWATLAGLCFVVGVVGTWVGAYAARRGQFQATQADWERIKGQLEETTRATETIKSIVSLGEWSERERRSLRRAKLEELLHAAHKAKDWLDLERDRTISFSNDASGASPFPFFITLGKLFFPEIQAQIGDFRGAFDAYAGFLLRIKLEYHRANSDAIDEVRSQDPVDPNWKTIVGIKTQERQAAIRQRIRGELTELYRSVIETLSTLDDAAAALMAEIIALPAAPAVR